MSRLAQPVIDSGPLVPSHLMSVPLHPLSVLLFPGFQRLNGVSLLVILLAQQMILVLQIHHVRCQCGLVLLKSMNR